MSPVCLHGVRHNEECPECGFGWTSVDAILEEAVLDAALWLEAEADHPRQDPRPAMRLQAEYLRKALDEARKS